jgi:hypothetical protein
VFVSEPYSLSGDLRWREKREKARSALGNGAEERLESVPFMSLTSKKRQPQDIDPSEDTQPPTKKAKLGEEMADTNVRFFTC